MDTMSHTVTLCINYISYTTCENVVSVHNYVHYVFAI